MNDDLDPTAGGPTPDDPTTRVETPATPATPTTPLVPAGRENPAPASHDREPAWTSAAPTVPVGPVVSTAPPRKRSRLRWAASLAVVALVIASSAAVAAIITGRSPDAAVLSYVPDQTVLYSEVRLDLPGDQRRAVGEFLSKFPGFADQAALETKLDEVLDDLVKQASNGEQTYSANIKPWFGGELAVAVGPLPKASAISDPEAALDSSRALVLVSVKDATTATAWFDAAITKSGAKTTTETYGGATLTVFSDSGKAQAALAVLDGKVVVAGDIASVKAAIDTKGDGGFADEPGPKAALASADGDHVGFAYMDLKAVLAWSTDLNKAIGSQVDGLPSALAIGDCFQKAVPDWGAYWLRFQSDALVMEATTPRADKTYGPTENRTSTVAQHIPSTAVVAAISNDTGATLKDALALYACDQALKPMLDELDKGLGLVGGTDAALGWIGDSAVVVNVADGTPELGLVIAPTDKAAAERLSNSLRAFIAIGGAAQHISIKDETYNGTTITTLDFGDLAALGGATDLEAFGSKLPSGHLEIAYAVTDDVVVIGSGPGFVKHVLDTTKDSSLASAKRYSDLVDRAGKGTGNVFVDIAAIRGLIEKAATTAEPDGLAKYEKDIKPFLAPLDVLFTSSSVSNDLTRSVIYVTVK